MGTVEQRLNIKKIIFDLDGVITSERLYWNSSVMTVYEKMFGELNVHWCEENISKISDEMFLCDRTIVTLKNYGVNSNIDLAYAFYLAVLVGQSKRLENDELWEYAGNYYEELMLNAPELYDAVANDVAEIYNYDFNYVKRGGELWLEIEDIFQHWYFGDEMYRKYYGRDIPGISGKTGFMNYETPIVEIEELKSFLRELKEKGYLLGIATGRNDFEVENPLKMWELSEFFDTDSIATYDTVVKAQKRYKKESLTKPHPYSFLKAAYPEIEDEETLISRKNDDNSHILVVGDAGADIIAAQAANMTFAAVLTGVNSKSSYEYFLGMNSDIIEDNVLELKKYL